LVLKVLYSVVYFGMNDRNVVSSSYLPRSRPKKWCDEAGVTKEHRT
jgi:hypothetical protein